MTVQLQHEMERLKKELLQLVALVEMNLKDAIKALETKDRELAEKVIEHDEAIDQLEVRLEETCMHIMARYQPVAVDLRFLVAVLKINSDLERIGDQAVNIAERSQFMAESPMPVLTIDFHEMVEVTRSMLHESLTALLTQDVVKAQKVRQMDDRLDEMNRQVFFEVRNGIRENPDNLRNYMNLLSASRHLERIGDHACNIAEDVIYMVEGEIVRHGGRPRQPRQS